MTMADHGLNLEQLEQEHNRSAVLAGPPAVQPNLRHHHPAPAPNARLAAKEVGRVLTEIGAGLMEVGEKGLHIAGEVAPHALGAAAAVAAPVGLAAQCVISGIALRSAYKSHVVWSEMTELFNDIRCGVVKVTCTALPGADLGNFKVQAHQMVLFQVLPYICAKKQRKEDRQNFKAAPVVGLGAALYSVGKKVQKKAQGTLGVNRHLYARWLAYHFMTCDCMVAQQMVSLLFAGAETGPFEQLEYDELTERLMDKMKSV
ncbi:MAG: hypothetical protein ABR987_15860 [Terracidiphilus sp.]|jgi:hypothetical protein